MSNANGPDISVWSDQNSTPQMYDPKKTRARGGAFVGIKVSQSNWADPDYAMNWYNCKNILYRLPYHFLVWEMSPARQAETFWSLLEKDVKDVLPLICDFEWWSTVPSNAMDILYNFQERMKQLASPLPLGIYSAKSFWDQYSTDNTYWQQYYLWLCDIAGPVEIPKPWTKWNFWQYTFKLNGPEWGAESLDLDGNYYNGTEEDMVAEFKLGPLNDSGSIVVPPSTTKKYFIPTVSDLNMRSSSTNTITTNKVGKAILGGQNLIVDEKLQDGYHWVETEVWMATNGFGNIVEK